MLHIPARTHLWLVCWLFLYCSVYVSVRNSFNVCVPPLPLIMVLWDHLLHEYRFQNIFLMLPGNLSLCTCAKRGLYLSPCTCFMGLCTLSNNCFTRVNRRLVNSFSYSNRIFEAGRMSLWNLKVSKQRPKDLGCAFPVSILNLEVQQYASAFGEPTVAKIKQIMMTTGFGSKW